MTKKVQIVTEDGKVETLPLALGQTVYVLEHQFRDKVCPLCDGSNYVEIKGTNYTCPKCGGKGTVRRQIKAKVETRSVRSIQINNYTERIEYCDSHSSALRVPGSIERDGSKREANYWLTIEEANAAAEAARD